MTCIAGRTKKFLTERATTLASTATGKNFTADADTDIMTSNGHGLTTGNGPVVLTNSGGAVPAGLAVLTSYWPIKIDANTFYLSASREDAANGVYIDLTDNGSGTNTVKRQSTASAFLERLRARTRPDTIKAATDIDTLA